MAEGEPQILEDYGISEPEESFAQILRRDGSVIETTDAVAGPLLGPDELSSLSGARMFDAHRHARER